MINQIIMNHCRKIIEKSIQMGYSDPYMDYETLIRDEVLGDGTDK